MKTCFLRCSHHIFHVLGNWYCKFQKLDWSYCLIILLIHRNETNFLVSYFLIFFFYFQNTCKQKPALFHFNKSILIIFSVLWFIYYKLHCIIIQKWIRHRKFRIKIKSCWSVNLFIKYTVFLKNLYYCLIRNVNYFNLIYCSNCCQCITTWIYQITKKQNGTHSISIYIVLWFYFSFNHCTSFDAIETATNFILIQYHIILIIKLKYSISLYHLKLAFC